MNTIALFMMLVVGSFALPNTTCVSSRRKRHEITELRTVSHERHTRNRRGMLVIFVENMFRNRMRSNAGTGDMVACIHKEMTFPIVMLTLETPGFIDTNYTIIQPSIYPGWICELEHVHSREPVQNAEYRCVESDHIPHSLDVMVVHKINRSIEKMTVVYMQPSACRCRSLNIY